MRCTLCDNLNDQNHKLICPLCKGTKYVIFPSIDDERMIVVSAQTVENLQRKIEDQKHLGYEPYGECQSHAGLLFQQLELQTRFIKLEVPKTSCLRCPYKYDCIFHDELYITIPTPKCMEATINED